MKFRYLSILLIFFLCCFIIFITQSQPLSEPASTEIIKTDILPFEFPYEKNFLNGYFYKKAENKKEIYLYPSGQSCGLKLLCDGVLVLSSAAAEDGKSDVRTGDYIVSFNNVKLKNSSHLEKLVSENKEKPVKLEIKREDKLFTVTVYPKSLDNNTFALGFWVRDSAAGLGTMTYITRDKKYFAALGHSVTDPETGSFMPLKKGELLSANVFDIKKGYKGTPGELVGVFTKPEQSLGEITANDEFGIYGKLSDKKFTENLVPLPIAEKNEIKTGKAEIISTVENSEPAHFSVKIIKIMKKNSPAGKNMIIEVTDKKLLEKTGGIVQGMSGSPIVQNGKLVGAVTHVFVNDPTRGYGIFIENMLAEAEKIK